MPTQKIGPPSKRKRATDGEEILQQLRTAEAAMRKQTMITNANAERSRDPPQAGGHGNSLPRKVEEGNDRQDVINHHHDGGKPIDSGFVFGCYHPTHPSVVFAARRGLRQGGGKATPLLLL